MNGHPGVVHGGLTSAMFDNTFGWLFFALGKPAAVTANLNVDFRKPVYAGSVVVIKARLQREEGRKMFMTATMENSLGTIVAESTSLFIMLKKYHLLLNQAQSVVNWLWGSQ